MSTVLWGISPRAVAKAMPVHAPPLFSPAIKVARQVAADILARDQSVDLQLRFVDRRLHGFDNLTETTAVVELAELFHPVIRRLDMVRFMASPECVHS